MMIFQQHGDEHPAYLSNVQFGYSLYIEQYSSIVPTQKGYKHTSGEMCLSPPKCLESKPKILFALLVLEVEDSIMLVRVFSFQRGDESQVMLKLVCSINRRHCLSKMMYTLSNFEDSVIITLFLLMLFKLYKRGSQH